MRRATRQFLLGMGSILDVFGQVRTTRSTTKLPVRLIQTDAEALRGDVQRIGGDLRAAMGRVAEEQGIHVEEPA